MGRIRVLHVDDDPDFAATTAAVLGRESDRFEFVTETDPAEALETVRSSAVDCVVSDLEMPGMTGIELLEAVREHDPDLPFILFTGEGSEAVASDAIGAGVTDYLRKGETGQYERLARRIENAVAQSRVASELATTRGKLERLHESSLELTDATTKAEIFDLTIAAAEDILEFHTSAICELQDGVFEPVALRNLDDDFERLGAGEGLIGEAYRTGDSLLVDDAQAADAAEPIRETYRSVLTVPIGEFGVFQAVAETRGVFDEDDLELTELLASHAASALETVTSRRELRAANEQLEAILNNTTAVIYAKDSEGRYTLVNDRFADVIDMAPDEVVGLTDFDIHSPETARAVRENDRRALEEGGPVEVEERTLREGVERTYLSVKVPMYDDAGDPIGVCGISTDITERKVRERELAYKESLLEAVTESALDGILVVDDDREFVTYNDRFVEMWELPSELLERGDDEAALEAVTDLLEDPESFRETVEYFYDNPSATGRNPVHLADGRTFDRFTAPVSDEENYYGRVWYFRDITDRIERLRELRNRTRELERQNERLDEFTSIVSHDIRGPLSVAKGRLDLAAADRDDDHVEAAYDAVTRMESIVEQTLTLARQGQTVDETEPVALETVAAECWEMVPTGAATLSVADEVTVLADRDRTKQILENLFRNAVEHGADEGREPVTVRVGATDGGFFVADDGPGVPEAERDRVFEPGHTTDDDGTGFGLAIVDGIAEAHGWTVSLTEGASGGARFEFSGVESPS